MTTTPARTDALPLRLHHNAYVCTNQERTRHFYEDIIGLPLLATWIEEGEFPDFPGRKLCYSHTFYGIADGGALAFFEFADPEVAAAYKAKRQPLFVHIALAVTEAGQYEIQRRLDAAGLAVTVRDHGYCRSIYVEDPDGLLVEFTADAPDVDAINAHQLATAHDSLKRWSAGDRRVNNDIRPHR
ncbi:Catechol 2,3-dioxygenase [Enhydrobacter aerosaccus]|uniref:Catechol 2,3-dioxygenase n=1 Tax=Enhydrobacter aerosaccus TaxID=225324 RepID=A0A1T4JUG9_9HYPH|nr:VOC family protein [Enhydrobacter aerosaccus]SJZ33850.1 Catechol 2,3-dioxygenase [Enhydrobacter aerosaccus]